MTPPNRLLVPLAIAGLLAAPAWAEEPAALADVVITGRRTPTPIAETPQRIDLIDEDDIELTPARELTDLLKKNAGIDVIQYPGNLSGIGLRGFRPEFSGLNKRVLLLVDGRPAMASNLSLVNVDRIERIEVMKGPASALYGAQAMGGVVNLITRQSRGAPAGRVEAGLGSADARELRLRAGGSLAKAIDADYAGSAYRQGDYRVGDGETRPATGYRQQQHALRIGADLAPGWRLGLQGDLYRGRDIATPGDIAYGTSDQSRKDMDRHGLDLRLEGEAGRHALRAVAYDGAQSYELDKLTSRTAADARWLPYRSFEESLRWRGLQLQDAWRWAPGASLVAGIDLEDAASTSRSYGAAGSRVAPFAADHRRRGTGTYLQQSLVLDGGRTTLQAGLRYDRIRVETLATPYKSNFTPGSASFGSTSPSVGAVHRFAERWQLHATVGRGFVAPAASELTGEAVATSSRGVVETTRGNAALKPESSVSADLGLGWTGPAAAWDLTVFDTRVHDKITRDAGTPTGPDARLYSYVNASSARMRGLELEARWSPLRSTTLSVAGTRLWRADQEVPQGREDIANVAKATLRVAAELHLGDVEARFAGRYVGPRTDQDTPLGGYAAWDFAGRWRLAAAQSIGLAVENLFDRVYAEKLGYPQPGRSLRASYRHEF